MSKLMKAYSHEFNVIGEIISENFLDGTVVLRDGERILNDTNRRNIVELKELGMLRDALILNHDVLENVDNGEMHEVELDENGKLRIYKLNSKYERLASDVKGYIPNLNKLSIRISLLDNVFKLRASVEKFNFNIKLVKLKNTYFYACNDVERENIDLIKVVFVGQHLLKEEEYKRTTVSYQGYLKLVESGNLVDANPNELLDLLRGGSKPSDLKVNTEPLNIHEHIEVNESYEKCDYYGAGGSEDCLCCEPVEDEDEYGHEDYVNSVDDDCIICGEDIFDCDCD